MTFQRTHGMAGQRNGDSRRHPLYMRWVQIRQKCTNPNSHRWKDYGGRGIRVCARWDDFALFVADLMALPHALEPGYSIDRMNVNGHYEPSNVKWSTAAEQRHNQRRVLKGRTEEQEASEVYGEDEYLERLQMEGYFDGETI